MMALRRLSIYLSCQENQLKKCNQLDQLISLIYKLKTNLIVSEELSYDFDIGRFIYTICFS